ncbi:MAG: response regulator transcription factor [Bacteroidia bacterium]|nr:response regulator transcription factor [Bacteroidia bacterium]
MKVLIIDNDQKIRQGLKTMIEKFCPQVVELNEANAIQSGIEAIAKYNPDLIFLDVELDEGTGMDLLSKLKEYKFDVVFITAYNKYAVDAFKFSAIDFILKPIGLEDLLNALQKAKTSLANKDLLKQLVILKENMGSLSSSEKKIVLKDSGTMYFIKVSDIIHCKAEGNYTEFYLVNKQKLVTSNMLKEYEAMLEPYGFIRTHHSHLINIKKIVRFDKADGGSLLLENNHNVPVSQRKKDQVLEALSKI